MAQNLGLSMLFSSTAEEEAFMREADLRRLLPNYRRPSRLSQMHHHKGGVGRLVRDISPWDILIGRSRTPPGNVLLRKIIRNSQQYYLTLDPTDRRRAQDALVALLESRGIRFLEPVDGGSTPVVAYREASYYAVMEKLRKAMRDPRPSRRGAAAAAALERAPQGAPGPASSSPHHASPPPTQSTPAQPVDDDVVVHVSPSWRPDGVQPGDRLGIFWPQDDVYYPGTVARVSGTFVRFHYEDGEKETIDLTRHKYVVLGKSPVYEEWFSSTALHNKPKPVAVGLAPTAPAATALPPAVTPKSSSSSVVPAADAGTTTTTTTNRHRRVSLPPRAKPSPDNSTQTEKTSNPPSSSHPSTASSSEPPHAQKRKKGRSTTVVWAGTFKPTAAAPAASSLAAFLSHKVKRVE